MEFDGSQIQNEIYLSGETPWPVSFADWEARAQEILEPGPFGYIAGGAGSEATMRANLEAFERRRLRPKMLTGNAVRDLSVEVLGTRSPVPFFLAPVGVLSIAHAEGELADPSDLRTHRARNTPWPPTGVSRHREKRDGRPLSA